MEREEDLRSAESTRDDSRNEVIETRSERFVDTKQDTLLKSGNLNEMNSFYQGSLVHERISAIRKSIYHIRSNWSKFDQFAQNLKSFMENEAKSTGGISDDTKKLFERRRNWADLEKSSQSFGSMKEEFNILTLYTTKEGFKEIFKISDGIFRTDSSINYADMIENAVFLVELINIDLFNFVYKYPQYNKFDGIVYRGMAIPESKFNVFEALLAQPINKRYISIPHSLWSSSTQIATAMGFIEEELKKYPKNVPLLMMIHVLNLDEEYLEFYRNKYGYRSVVTSICAVPIHELSRYPEEAEVILRGGFYQALNFYDKKINGKDFKVLELVMLNTNRDHLSNPTKLNEKEDAEARVLIGTMVGVARNRFAVKYYKDNELLDDMEKYEIVLKEGEEKLKTLMTLQ